MNRRNVAVAGCALLALSFTIGCKKGSKGSKAGGGEILTHIPKDTTMLVGLGLGQAANSPLFKKYEESFMKDIPEEVTKMKETCGLDMMTDLHSVVISGGKDMEDDSDTLFAVQGSFDKAKIEDCVTKSGGKVEGGDFTIEGETLHSYWPASNVVLLSKGMTTDQMKAGAGAGSVNDSETMGALLKKVNTSSAIWAVGEIPASASGGLQMMGLQEAPKTFHASVGVSSGVDVSVGIAFEKEEGASAASTMANGGLTMAKGQAGDMASVLEKVKISQEGTSLLVKVNLSAEDIEKAKGMAGALPF